MIKANTNRNIDNTSKNALADVDVLQLYLSEMKQYKLISRKKEKELGNRIKNDNDSKAEHILISANLRLVIKIALQYQRAWKIKNPTDLIQEGNVGLIQAAKKFDPAKNVKFSSYAVFWIKAYIITFIMKNWSLVKIGTTQAHRNLFFNLGKEKKRLIQQGVYPHPKVISERMGIPEYKIKEMDQRMYGRDVSLNNLIKDDSSMEKIDFLHSSATSVEELVTRKEIKSLVRKKIADLKRELSKREIDIFELRIFSDNPVSLQHLGNLYGISRERVRQVEANVMKKVREFFINDASICNSRAYADLLNTSLN